MFFSSYERCQTPRRDVPAARLKAMGVQSRLLEKIKQTAV
jgi:hypothetical protein